MRTLPWENFSKLLKAQYFKILYLRRLPQSGAISDRALNSEMMSTMDLVAGKGWAVEEEGELMSTMDRVVDGGRAVLLLARCCKVIKLKFMKIALIGENINFCPPFQIGTKFQSNQVPLLIFGTALMLFLDLV